MKNFHKYPQISIFHELFELQCYFIDSIDDFREGLIAWQYSYYICLDRYYQTPYRRSRRTLSSKIRVPVHLRWKSVFAMV